MMAGHGRHETTAGMATYNGKWRKQCRGVQSTAPISPPTEKQELCALAMEGGWEVKNETM